MSGIEVIIVAIDVATANTIDALRVTTVHRTGEKIAHELLSRKFELLVQVPKVLD